MLAAALSLCFSAAPAPPALRAVDGAELVVVLPRLDALVQTAPFMALGQDKSTFLRAATYRDVTHPLVSLDVFDPAAARALGVDVERPFTLSSRGDVSVSCHSLADAGVYDKAVGEKLNRLGEVKSVEVSGVTVHSAKDSLGRVLAASIRKGAEACAVTGHGQTLEPELPKLAKLLTKAASGPGLALTKDLKGQARLVVPSGKQHGGLALAAEGLTLKATAKAKGLPLATLAPPGPSPFAKLTVPGLAVLRLRLTPEALVPVLRQSFRQMPKGEALLPVAEQLAPELSGNVAVVATRVKVAHGLKSPAARFYAVKFALLAELNEGAREKAKALVASVDPKQLAVREGGLLTGLSGDVVFLANDAAAKDAALAALPKAKGAQAHAAELVVDPKQLAQGLAQVPLLEAVQVPMLAGLLAASTELGPLLTISEKIEGSLDPVGADVQRGELSWTLSPPDAGVDGGVDGGVDAGRR